MPAIQTFPENCESLSNYCRVVCDRIVSIIQKILELIANYSMVRLPSIHEHSDKERAVGRRSSSWEFFQPTEGRKKSLGIALKKLAE